MSAITLHPGDNRESLRRLIDAGVRVHSVVTDPPYGLTSVTKRFGGDKAAPAKFGSDGAFARVSAGFMNSRWDGTGIERDPEFWALIWDILLPGGYCLAFSSARTGHWQACAMEMAGFVMHPFFGWATGQGFPKAHNAAKAIDREIGCAGSFGAAKSEAHAGWIERGRMRGAEGAAENHEGWQRPWMEDAQAVSNAARHYIPGSPEAAQWQGWAYGAQSVKPALEPIYIGQKPFSEKNGALNLLRHGVGALNIDACRVDVTGERLGGGSEKAETAGSFNKVGWERPWQSDAAALEKHAGLVRGNVERATTLGRHPANLLHDGSPEVVAMFPDSKGQQARSTDANRSQVHTYGATSDNGKIYEPRNDSGSASRFFNSFPTSGDSGTDAEHPPLESLDADPLFYHAKATKADRAGSKHPTVKPIALMRWLVRLATPPGGTVLDPFAGSGTTGAAAQLEGFDCILMEAEAQFIADIRRRFGLTVDPFAELVGITTACDPFAELVG